MLTLITNILLEKKKFEICVFGCHLLLLKVKPVWNKPNNGAILLWQVAPKSGMSLYVLNEHAWIVLIWHRCASQCLCKQLCSDIQYTYYIYIYHLYIQYICSIATNEQNTTSISNLNINCISGLAIVELNRLWLIHLEVITLRTRYNLVCESHQTRREATSSWKCKTP